MVGQKPKRTTALKIDFGNNTFADHFIGMTKLTGQIVALHFMRRNSVVFDTTHGLVHFPYQKMQCKSRNLEGSAKTQPNLSDKNLKVAPKTMKIINVFSDHPS